MERVAPYFLLQLTIDSTPLERIRRDWVTWGLLFLILVVFEIHFAQFTTHLCPILRWWRISTLSLSQLCPPPPPPPSPHPLLFSFVPGFFLGLYLVTHWLHVSVSVFTVLYAQRSHKYKWGSTESIIVISSNGCVYVCVSKAMDIQTAKQGKQVNEKTGKGCSMIKLMHADGPRTSFMNCTCFFPSSSCSYSSCNI